MRLLLVTDSQSATIELDLGLTEAGIGAWGGGIVHADPDHVLGYPSNVWGVVSRPVSVGFGNATASSIVFTQSDVIEVYGEKTTGVAKSFLRNDFRIIKRGLYR
jgi:hypothetical protein